VLKSVIKSFKTAIELTEEACNLCNLNEAIDILIVFIFSTKETWVLHDCEQKAEEEEV